MTPSRTMATTVCSKLQILDPRLRAIDLLSRHVQFGRREDCLVVRMALLCSTVAL
jgi:hypothetical protein